jgi:hypothetical protein
MRRECHRSLIRRVAHNDGDTGHPVTGWLRFHDLRHTFASHLIIDIRLDVAQVSRILGHARTSMALDTYTHLFEEARDANARAAPPRRQAPPLNARLQPYAAAERLRNAPPLRPVHRFQPALRRDQNVTNGFR